MMMIIVEELVMESIVVVVAIVGIAGRPRGNPVRSRASSGRRLTTKCRMRSRLAGNRVNRRPKSVLRV